MRSWNEVIIPPPAVIGVFGSGQLGRMLALAARAMGYRIHTFSPDKNSPTGQIADREVSASYADLDAVRDFVRQVQVVTFEFENVAAAVAQVAEEEGVPVRPGGWVLHTTQERLREKQFLAAIGLPVTPFAPVHTLDSVGCRIRPDRLPCHPQDRRLWLRRERPGAPRPTGGQRRPPGRPSASRRLSSRRWSTST